MNCANSVLMHFVSDAASWSSTKQMVWTG